LTQNVILSMQTFLFKGNLSIKGAPVQNTKSTLKYAQSCSFEGNL